MRTNTLPLLFIISYLCSASAGAEVHTPRFITDGMVLQRGDTARIWGTADPGEQVCVTLLKRKYRTTADATGHWSVGIPTQQKRMVGGPYTLQINDRTLQDVYVGDVWLCSGQSNMDLHTARLVDLYKEEFDTSSNPAIHLMQTGRNPQTIAPLDDIDPRGFYAWEALSPETVGHWSGIGYFFAKEMYERTGGVPQGIIAASMGGSDIAAWCSREVLAQQAPDRVQELDYLLTEGYQQRASEVSRAISAKYYELRDQQDPGLTGQWMQPDLDVTDWEEIDQFAPTLGDQNGQRWTGSLWLRREFDVPAEWLGQDSLLRLGCLIDADVTYVNGVKVGETGYQYPPRKYTLPQGLLKAGRNVVTVRLMSAGTPMHFMPEKPYKLLFHGGGEVSLEGKWLMHRGVMMPQQPGVRNVSNATGTSLYNNVIHPLLPYRVAGILWYQGETNAGRPEEYLRLLPAMIDDWRLSFGKVPALIFGLANFMERHDDADYYGGWARLRESQRLSAEQLDRAALVTLIDLGEWNDIHPLRKKDAAHRAALQMQRLYLDAGETSEGPAFDHVSFTGSEARIAFRPGTAEGLELREPQPHSVVAQPVRRATELSAPDAGFALQDKAGKWHWANVRIEGSQLVVWSEEVSEPQQVRYAWDDDPRVTLYNAAGLPAAPFMSK